MPLVNISLLEGRPQAHRRAIADGVHQALVATYDVPAKDRFQLINEYGPEDLIFEADYMDIHRTSDVVFIHITASNTRTLEKKKALYKAIADNLSRNPGLRPEDVQVIIADNTPEDWSFGEGKASYA